MSAGQVQAAGHGHAAAKVRKPGVWRILLPVAVAVAIALIPAPAGLAPHAWYYFAIFAAVIAGLVVEPLPGPAVALIGVVLVTVLAPWVLFSPAEMAKPGFKAADESLRWALSAASQTRPCGWSSPPSCSGSATRRPGSGGASRSCSCARSGAARSGSATPSRSPTPSWPRSRPRTRRAAPAPIFPVVRNLPPLYGSLPNDPSARDVGSYIMWTTFAAGCITSSLFLTALAPNLLAVEFIRKIANVDITWAEWFFAAAPFALPLLLVLPALTYVVYPPRIKHNAEVPAWAAGELERMGPLSRREMILAVLVAARGPDVDLRRPLRRGDHGGAHRPGADAGDARRDLGGHGGQQGGLDDALAARTPGDAGRGLSRTGFIKWFADYRRHAHGRAVADAVAPGARLDLLFLALHVREHHRPHHRDAARDAGGRHGRCRVCRSRRCDGARRHARHHGHHHALCDRAGARLLRERLLPTGEFWKLGTLYGLLFLGALLAIGVPLLLMRG